MKELLKKIGVGFTVGLAMFAGLALAQNINRAIQLSQDPTGAISVDTQNNVYWPGHFLLNTANRPAPVVSGCGTAPTLTGTDMSMKLTTGSAATTCTVTFGTAYVTAPQCLVVGSAAIIPTYTTSTTALAMTVDVASTIYNIVCMSVS